MMDSSCLPKRLKPEDDSGNVGNALQTGGEMKSTRGLVDLPEEILESIFSFVTDAEDLENVTNASPQFSRILGPTKQTWLFNKVFPLIYPNLDKTAILNCRHVCKEWKKGVDNCLQTQPLVRIMEDYKQSESTEGTISSPTVVPYAPQFQQNLCRKRFMSIRFDNADTIARFMESARENPGNPFVLRAISLNDGPYGGEAQNLYWANVFCLLETYGQHIWHLYIHTCYDNDHHHARYCYKMLNRCLTNLPNLRTMAVRGFTNHFYHGVDMDIPGRPYSTSRLANYVKSNPLPSLPFLQVLEIGLQDTAENYLVHNELVRKYSSHTTSVITPLTLWKQPREFLGELTRMEIFVDNTVYRWALFCDILSAPNLRRLSLIIHENVIFVEMLRPLLKFTRLQYLSWRFFRRLEIPLGTLRPIESPLILPQIKTLEVMDNPYVPYSLMAQHMPNLEYMLICCEDEDWWKPRSKPYLTLEEDDQSHYSFKNWAFSQAMRGVNLWELLVNLKEITLGWMGSDQFTLYEIVTTKTFARESYRKNRHEELALADGIEY